MHLSYRKCRSCGQRSRRKDRWAKTQPVTTDRTGLEEIAGTSTANVLRHGWTRSTYKSSSVLITCPQCEHTVTVRDKRSQRFW